MKRLIVKGSSFTCQGEHLNANIQQNVISQTQNLKNPIKPKKTTTKPNKTQNNHRAGFFFNPGFSQPRKTPKMLQIL